MWVRDHEPQMYARTFKMLHAKDYLNFRLTGVMATEYSDASGTNLLDLNTLRWSEKLVGNHRHRRGECCPTLKASTDVVGALTARGRAGDGPARRESPWWPAAGTGSAPGSASDR